MRTGEYRLNDLLVTETISETPLIDEFEVLDKKVSYAAGANLMYSSATRCTSTCRTRPARSDQRPRFEMSGGVFIFLYFRSFDRRPSMPPRPEESAAIVSRALESAELSSWATIRTISRMSFETRRISPRRRRRSRANGSRE